MISSSDSGEILSRLILSVQYLGSTSLFNVATEMFVWREYSSYGVSLSLTLGCFAFPRDDDGWGICSCPEVDEDASSSSIGCGGGARFDAMIYSAGIAFAFVR